MAYMALPMPMMPTITALTLTKAAFSEYTQMREGIRDLGVGNDGVVWILVGHYSDRLHDG